MTDPRLRHSAAHVFVASLDAPHLEPVDEHHLARVLRLRPGDDVSLVDGTGRWASGRWTGSGVAVDEIHPAEAGRAAGLLAVACAIAKGDRPELVVQKLTELGIDRIVLYDAARGVVRWDDRKRAAQLERLARIAREAAMQSRQLRVPAVAHEPWSEVVASDARVAGGGVALAEPGGRSGWWMPGAAPAVRTIVIGPEGGFTESELAAVPDRVSLGPTILRVETAAIAAGVLLGAARADVVSPGASGSR